MSRFLLFITCFFLSCAHFGGENKKKKKKVGVGRVVDALGSEASFAGFDAQLGHLHDACTTLPQKSSAAIK